MVTRSLAERVTQLSTTWHALVRNPSAISLTTLAVGGATSLVFFQLSFLPYLAHNPGIEGLFTSLLAGGQSVWDYYASRIPALAPSLQFRPAQPWTANVGLPAHAYYVYVTPREFSQAMRKPKTPKQQEREWEPVYVLSGADLSFLGERESASLRRHTD